MQDKEHIIKHKGYSFDRNVIEFCEKYGSLESAYAMADEQMEESYLYLHAAQSTFDEATRLAETIKYNLLDEIKKRERSRGK